MADISIPREYSDDAVLSASELDAAFDSVETFLNTTGITDDNIQNSGITGATKLVNASVTSAKIANGAIGSTQIATGGIINSNIADGTIVGTKLVANTLTDTQVQAKGITAASIADGTITSTQISAGIGLVPAGAILPYGGTAAPTGWLMCDGTSYLQSSYPSLYTAIGNAYGAADGAHFNVPDLRGRFLRGVDGGAGRDPDTSSRTAMATGGNTGDNVGSVQSDAFKSHTHNYTYPNTAGANISSTSPSLQGNSNGSTTTAAGGNETRPVNAYVNYIIKT